jgi:hypothetical protein
VGAVVSNPLASLVYVFGAGGMTELDVGASLGILACAGAAASLLRRGVWLVVALGALAALSGAVTHSTLVLNHVVALALGWGVARLYFLAR